MLKLKIDGNDFVAGLNWFQLNDNKTSTLKERSKALDEKYGVVFEIYDDSVKKYQLGMADSPNYDGVISLALVLAKIKENALIIQEVDDKFWICAVAEGEVLISSDKVISEDEIKRSFEDSKEALDESGEDYDIFITNTVASVLDYHDGTNKDIQELIEGSDFEIEDFDDIKVGELYKDRTKQILLGAAILAASCFAFNELTKEEITIQDVQEFQNTAPLIDHEKIARDNENKRIAAELAAIEEAKAEEKKWLNDFINSYDSTNILNQFIDNVRKSELIVGGWKLNEVLWTTDNKDIINKVWESTGNIATALTFKNSMIGYDQLYVEISEKTAGSTEKIIIKDVESIDPFEVVYNEKNQREYLTSFMIKNDYQWGLNKNTDLRRKTPIDIIDDDDAKWMWLQPVDNITVNIGGFGLSSLERIKNKLSNFKNFKLNRVTYTQENNKWAISGVLYEKQD